MEHRNIAIFTELRCRTFSRDDIPTRNPLKPEACRLCRTLVPARPNQTQSNTSNVNYYSSISLLSLYLLFSCSLWSIESAVSRLARRTCRCTRIYPFDCTCIIGVPVKTVQTSVVNANRHWWSRFAERPKRVFVARFDVEGFVNLHSRWFKLLNTYWRILTRQSRVVRPTTLQAFLFFFFAPIIEDFY